MKKFICVCCLWIGLGTFSVAQEYRYGQQILVPPAQILPDQYTVVTLPETIIHEQKINVFDPTNPYTYLQMLYDSRNKLYQILFQTNFIGKIVFMAYSNNLTQVFKRKDKPMFMFQQCIRSINQHISALQVAELAVQCIIARLNYCSDQ